MEGESPTTERIGELLVKIGALKKWQVDDILLAQRSGDARIFGELAIALGYIDDEALKRYVDFHPFELDARRSP
jgi:hypothetical protein